MRTSIALYAFFALFMASSTLATYVFDCPSTHRWRKFCQESCYCDTAGVASCPKVQYSDCLAVATGCGCSGGPFSGNVAGNMGGQNANTPNRQPAQVPQPRRQGTGTTPQKQAAVQPMAHGAAPGGVRARGFGPARMRQ